MDEEFCDSLVRTIDTAHAIAALLRAWHPSGDVNMRAVWGAAVRIEAQGETLTREAVTRYLALETAI